MNNQHNFYKVMSDTYATLSKNEWYWTMDNDYRRKYEQIKEAATTDINYSRGTVAHLLDIAKFMNAANRRIFH